MKVDVSGNRNQPIYSNFGKKGPLSRTTLFQNQSLWLKKKEQRKQNEQQKTNKQNKHFCVIFI